MSQASANRSAWYNYLFVLKPREISLLAAMVCLYTISLLLYFLTDFRLLYLIGANALGIAMIIANARLLMSETSKAAWYVYKLSSFPYLGLIFLLMMLDIWIR